MIQQNIVHVYSYTCICRYISLSLSLYIYIYICIHIYIYRERERDRQICVSAHYTHHVLVCRTIAASVNKGAHAPPRAGGAERQRREVLPLRPEGLETAGCGHSPSSEALTQAES